jgi:hypothetical protein
MLEARSEEIGGGCGEKDLSFIIFMRARNQNDLASAGHSFFSWARLLCYASVSVSASL